MVMVDIEVAPGKRMASGGILEKRPAISHNEEEEGGSE